MRSATATKANNLNAIIRRSIFPKLLLTIAISTLLPLFLGYAASEWFSHMNMPFTANHLFIVFGTTTCLVTSYALAECIVSFTKIEHLVTKPISRLTKCAEDRFRRGSTQPLSIRGRYSEMERMTAILAALFDEQDTRVQELLLLVHALNHNARKDLAIVTGELEFLQEGIRTPEQVIPEIQRDIASFCSHLDKFIGIASNYNRLKGPPPEEIDISSLTRECVNRLMRRANSKSIRIDAIYPEDKTVVLAHGHKISNILHNLIDNAIKFTPEGGVVTVRVGRKEGDDRTTTTFTVSDNGIGISEQEIPNIFKPNYRCPRSAHIEGQGLGLTLVLSEIRYYTGECTCTSEQGSGTTFAVTLPLKTKGPTK